MSYSKDLEKEFEQYAALIRISEKAHQVMPAEIVAAIAAVKNSVDMIRTLDKYVDEVKDVQQRGELMRIIGELSLALGEAQIQLAEASRLNHDQEIEIFNLKKEIGDLRKPQVELELNKIDGVFVMKGDERNAYCPNCYIGNKRITVLSRKTTLTMFYRCEVCNWTNNF